MVINALDVAWGGEIFVPKIPSYRLTDLAKAIEYLNPNLKINKIGILFKKIENNDWFTLSFRSWTVIDWN